MPFQYVHVQIYSLNNRPTLGGTPRGVCDVNRFSREMLIKDVLVSHPRAASVFSAHGLGCPSCLAAEMETLDAVASMHEVPVETLLAELEALPPVEEEV